MDAAVGILQDFGMGDLSMRRVAAVLGVQASALYWHVPDKQTLLARVADRIVAEVEHAVAARGGRGGAPADLEAATEAAEAVLLRHRDGAEVLTTALALGLGGLGLHRLLTDAAPTPEEGERALALLLGTVSLRQQRAQAQALGVAVGPDVQRRRAGVL